jgi:hypothetical protein
MPLPAPVTTTTLFSSFMFHLFAFLTAILRHRHIIAIRGCADLPQPDRLAAGFPIDAKQRVRHLGAANSTSKGRGKGRSFRLR